jgi:hypothetical protein
MGVDNVMHEGSTSEWLMMFTAAHYLQSKVKYVFIMQENSPHFCGFHSTYVIFRYETLGAFIQTIQLHKYTHLRSICSYCLDNIWCDSDPHVRLFCTYQLISYQIITLSQGLGLSCKVKKYITYYYIYFIN